MNNALKSMENNALAALTQRAPQGIVNAIKNAAAKTGVSFSYLMEKAAAESNFNPTVKARTSSATGLFQFIESTWMDMVNKHGAKYGIDTNQSRQDLLNLRKDPTIASYMAAEFACDNQCYLEKTIGGNIGETELYFAHFMGAGGASAFLSQYKKNPLAIAADLFPKEARANKNVFYDSKTGEPKTLQQVYDFFDKKFTDGTETKPANTMAHETAVTKRKRSEGYQHIPPSLYQKAAIENTNIYSKYAAHRIGREMDAFFGQRTADSGSVFPASLYGNIESSTSMLLTALRIND